MNKQPVNKDAQKESQGADKRVDISTADDINVDEDNAVGSPKESLTAEPPRNEEPAQEKAPATSSSKNPGDEVAPGIEQTGRLPCERCGGTGRLDSEACPECGGTGEVVVNVGDA